MPTYSESILGPAGKRCHPTRQEASGLAVRLTDGEMWVKLSVCRSEREEGGCTPGLPQCLIRGSLPSQLDEEEERRKRRREKNKVAAARCRNKKKERTEFLQRVSRAVARGDPGLVL